MVYRLLEQQMYCKYLNNIQCEVPVVLDAINQISVVVLSMNSTYLFSVDEEDTTSAHIVEGVCDVIK